VDHADLRLTEDRHERSSRRVGGSAWAKDGTVIARRSSRSLRASARASARRPAA